MVVTPSVNRSAVRFMIPSPWIAAPYFPRVPVRDGVRWLG